MVKLKHKNRLAKIQTNGIVKLPLKLNLGSGTRPYGEGFTRVDVDPKAKPDVLCDLSKSGWPFKSDSVDEVYSAHFLEHLTGPERMVFMNELWRVMKVGARAYIQVPYWSSMRAYQDPTHAWPPLCESSFLYFNRQWRKDNFLEHYPITCNWSFSYGYQLAPDTQTKAQEVQIFQAAHYINSVMDLVIHLEKIPLL